MNQEPECKIRPDGTKVWLLNSKWHRLEGPAIEYSNGSKAWWLHGKRHRLDGPAIEHSDGVGAWYLHGMWLGLGDVGFWALWEKLDGEQRSNWELLQRAPWVK